jgi:cytochrome P450
MIIAGHDTTAISLRNALFFLLKNPKCKEKLRKELDEVLDEDKIVLSYRKINTYHAFVPVSTKACACYHP